MRLAIIGIELSQLVCAHIILDKHPDAEVHLISERAEAGLIGELPGLITQPLSNTIQNEWIGDLGSQTPTSSNTAVRRSWLEKAMATKLVERGANLHLRTTTQRDQTESGESITLFGAGYSSGSKLLVEKVITKSENKSSTFWKGGVHNDELNGSDYEGHRPDGLVEIWWPAEQEPPRSEGKWLQLMDWAGEDPSRSLEQEVELGHSLASFA